MRILCIIVASATACLLAAGPALASRHVNDMVHNGKFKGATGAHGCPRWTGTILFSDPAQGWHFADYV